MDDITGKVKWYIKYRTTIWGVVWFCVGLFGGNVDRMKDKIPTLQYSNQEVQQKLEEYNLLKENLIKTKEELDKMRSEGV